MVRPVLLLVIISLLLLTYIVAVLGYVESSRPTSKSVKIMEVKENGVSYQRKSQPVKDFVSVLHQDNVVKKEVDMGFMARAFLRARQRLAMDMDLGFMHAFLSSLAMIVVSELGDKTFFIAAIMAMRYSRSTVFLGAISALALMTVLSAILGFATTVIPASVTHVLSSVLFLVFGIKMLYEGSKMGGDEGKEEFEEVQADLKKREAELQASATSPSDVEVGAGTITRTPGRRWFYGIVSAIFLQSLVLTFLAEWGDRSQIATIVLAAREEVIGVIIGGILGHCFCTGLAVLGGRIVAQKISIRTVTIIGGVVFIIFAFSSFLIGV